MDDLSTGEEYSYDANGNMTAREEGGLTYTQTFDAENRLISVTVNSQTIQFVYDGDGALVKKVNPDGSKTIYIGGVYEVDKNSGGSVTRTVTYYPTGAMRINSTLYYVLKDDLGSASVVTDSSGNTVGEQRYFLYGDTRLTTGTMYTDKLFTGQRELAGLGIYHYGARFYSPKLGRFVSADTVVPNMANPQDLNRYSYVRNNPVRSIDPTGHVCSDPEDPTPSCSSGRSYPTNVTPTTAWRPTIGNYGVTVNGGTPDDHDQIEYELASMASVMADLVCTVQGDECSTMPDHMVFNSILGDSTINIWAATSEHNNVCIAYTTNVIDCYGFANHGLTGEAGLITHEYGHLLNYANPRIEAAIESSTIYTSSGEYVTGYRDGSYERTLDGYGIVHHDLDWLPGGVQGYEEFSDMWRNYVYDSFAEDKYGDARYGWMQNFMPLAVSWVMP